MEKDNPDEDNINEEDNIDILVDEWKAMCKTPA